MCESPLRNTSTQLLISIKFPNRKKKKLDSPRQDKLVHFARPPTSSHLLFPPVSLFLVAPFCSNRIFFCYENVEKRKKSLFLLKHESRGKPVLHSIRCCPIVGGGRAETSVDCERIFICFYTRQLMIMPLGYYEKFSLPFSHPLLSISLILPFLVNSSVEQFVVVRNYG